MNVGLLHRLVILLSFIVALVTFAFNMYVSGDILFSAFCALCVLFGVSIIMLAAMQSVASILLKHLQEKQRLQREAEAEALRKQAGKQQKGER